MITAGIYKIVNTINNNLYVGSSKHLDHRKWGHFSTLRHNRHPNQHLQFAYNKYGGENFIFEVIEIIEVEENLLQATLLEREQYWIDTLHPQYNIVQIAGSNVGYHHTEETKRRISQNMLGKKKSPEHAQHIRECQKGKTLTEEHKQKLKEAYRKSNTIRHHTQVMIDGILYQSVKEACETLHIPVSTMQKHLKSDKYPNFIKLTKKTED